MLNSIKKFYPNAYILIIAIGIALWFEGLNNIISYFIKSRDLYTGFTLCSIALIIFYMDDGKLNELYNLSQHNQSTQAAAAISAFKREN